MSRFQHLKDLLERRLLTAVIRDEGEQRTTCGYEEELQRQRKLLDVILIPEIKLHRADVQLLMVKKEELPPEQQERSPYPDQEDKESPLIKEDQEDKESPLIKEEQRLEQLQGLEEAGTKFLFPSVHMKSENNEEKPQSSLLHQRLTDHMETAAGGEDCGRPEPARSSDPERNLLPEIEFKIKASSDSGSGSEDVAETRDRLKRLKSATNKRAKTVKSDSCPEPGKTNHVVSLTAKRTFRCSICGKGFRQKAHRTAHMSVHTEKRPFRCSECGKGFRQKAHLTAHMTVHTEDRPFICSECGNGFKQKVHLTAHMSVHTEERPFSCSVCGNGFKLKKSLTEHMLVHSKEKPFICSVCGDGFKHKKLLIKHMRVHTNVTPFFCSDCGKGFKLRKSLIKHMSVHIEERPFICSECGKGFRQREHLTAHMSVHTEERPFSCSVCGNGFKLKKSLTEHMLAHTKEKCFICSDCGKVFKHKYSLIKHVFVHIKEKPFFCSKCGTRFYCEEHLTKHMSVHLTEGIGIDKNSGITIPCPADEQLLMVKKEERPPEQQERSPYPDQEDKESPLIKEEQEDKESPLIKEEQEELWISQGREQLQGLEEADTKFLFPSVHMKSENDEEKPQSSLLHQRLTGHMEKAAGGEDCGRPEPARSSDPERNLQPEIEVQIKASSDSATETEDEKDVWMETRDCLERLKSAPNKRAKTVKLDSCSEPCKTNHGVSLTAKRPFGCSTCGKGFKQKAHLMGHMSVHTKEKPFSCSECGNEYKLKKSLTEHMVVHSKEKPFICSLCGDGFKLKKRLIKHMLVHSKGKHFICSECGKGFKHKNSLIKHVFVHIKEKPFFCSVCGKRFYREEHLTKHMSAHLTGEMTIDKNSGIPIPCPAVLQLLVVKKVERPPEQKERSPYPDQEDQESPLIKKEQEDKESPLIHKKQEEPWINQGGEQLQGLEEAETKFLFPSVHMKSENDEEKPQSSLLHQRLTDHMETAAGGEDCGRPEPARSSDPERNLPPEIEVKIEASSDSATDSATEAEDETDDWMETRDCLERLKSAPNKRAEMVASHNFDGPGETNHVVSLTAKSPFSCSTCGKGFKHKAYLTGHMLVHTKVKRFICSDCGKVFKHKRSLIKHVLVHIKEKPFFCSKCGTRFYREEHLAKHMSTHLTGGMGIDKNSSVPLPILLINPIPFQFSLGEGNK